MVGFQNIPLTEDMLHVYAADVLRAFAVPGVVWFHVPNGGKRHISVAILLKKMGTRAGVSDFVFFRLDGKAACMELKDASGKQSKDQKEFERGCKAIGVPYVIARTCAEVDGVLSGFGVINKPSINSVTQPAEKQGCVVRGEGAAKVKGSRSQSLKRAAA